MSIALIFVSAIAAAGARPVASLDLLSETFARSGEEILHFALSEGWRPMSVDLRVHELRAPGSRGSATDLDNGSLYGPGCSEVLSFASTDAGSWGLALEVLGGGNNGLHLWRGDRGPLEQEGERGFAMVIHVFLENFASEEGADPTKMFDVLTPVLFVHGSEIVLVGAGRGMGGRFTLGCNEVVWMAPMDEADFVSLTGDPAPRRSKSLTARAIADGKDPRVAALGDRVVLAVRSADTRQEPDDVAALSFSTSTDLVDWTAAADLSADLAVTKGYALVADDDALWLAAATSEDPPRPGVLRFDADARSWTPVAFVEDGPAPPLPRARERLWLLPDPGPRGPLLVYRGADGALVRRQLP